MPFVHLLLHPFHEEVLEDGGAHVGDPLLRRLGQLEIGLRQILVDVYVVLGEELPDLLESEALVSIKNMVNISIRAIRDKIF